MRLAELILANIDRILQSWEDFARSLPSGSRLTAPALRDHAERMLRFIAQDMETQQSQRQQFDKSIGAGPQPRIEEPSAAQEHGSARAANRFSLSELVSEYRALRASVLSLWLERPDTEPDVQQLVRFNESIDQLIAESVQSYSARVDREADTFTASIGHDLRNPLNAISMSAQLLNTSTTVSHDDRCAVDQIARSALRMGTMLGELQDFSRTRLGGTLHLERERVDIGDLCEEVVREIRASTPDCRIVFSQAGNTVALASRERLEQLVSNLILNAVQHGEAGCDVHVFVNGQDRVLHINVSNTGTPIPPDKLDRIFEPLYRTERNQHADMNRNHLGLGLYIARTIAIAHGGDIDVTSTRDEGTTFRVHLPRER